MKADLAKQARKFDNLEEAWRVIQRNGRYSNSDEIRREIEQFSENASKKLRSIQNRLARNKFEFGLAKGVPVKKADSSGKPTGRIRPLVIAPLESRIVQRAILNILVDVPGLQSFVRTPYSFGGLRKIAEPHSPDGPALSAVPAAIEAVLNEIRDGAKWVACADISSFFTRISKSSALEIVSSNLNDQGEFVDLVKTAIHVELRNLEELREYQNDFPIEDLGVAQGNSLSPLLGNIVLAEFDRKMNAGDCRCIRYIDDFIILAPSEKAANARLKLAQTILNELGMQLSPEKSSKKAQEISKGFEFLGIEISPGLIRPAPKARKRFLSKIKDTLEASKKGLFALKHGNSLTKSDSLIQSLKRLDGIVDGWGKHYWFRNDSQTFRDLDSRVQRSVEEYLSAYYNLRNDLSEDQKHLPLGLTNLSIRPRTAFSYPSKDDVRTDEVIHES